MELIRPVITPGCLIRFRELEAPEDLYLVLATRGGWPSKVRHLGTGSEFTSDYGPWDHAIYISSLTSKVERAIYGVPL